MADNDDWLSEATAEPEPVAAEAAPEPAAEEAGAEETLEDALEELDDEPVRKRQDRGDRLILFKYWKRSVHILEMGISVIFQILNKFKILLMR